MSTVLPNDPLPYLHEGTGIEAVRGPLQGVHGIILRIGNQHWLVIGVPLILGAAGVDVMPV